MNTQNLAGAVVSSQVLQQMVRETGATSSFSLGGFPLPEAALSKHVLVVGGVGTGKTQALQSLLVGHRKQGLKTVVVSRGDHVPKFFRPGTDYLLNPLDARCVSWDVLSDIADERDAKTIAEAFLPGNPMAGKNALVAHLILADVFLYAKQNGWSLAQVCQLLLAPKCSFEEQGEIFQMLTSMEGESSYVLNALPYDDMHQALFFASSEFRANKALQALAQIPSSEKRFSIREWVAQQGDSWLFLTSVPPGREASLPIIKAALGITLDETMRLPPVPDPRVAVVVEELDVLGHVANLPGFLVMARKYGASFAASATNISRLNTLLPYFQNHLFLRCNDVDTAKIACEFFGKTLQVSSLEAKANHKASTRGLKGFCLKTLERWFTKRRDVIQDVSVVHPVALMTLPDLTGFIKIAGHYPVAKVAFKLAQISGNEPEFIKAKRDAA